MVEKGIREGICDTSHQYSKTNNKYMKGCDKNKKSWDLKYWDVNNLYGWIMSQKLQQIIFRESKIFLNLMKISQEAIMKKVAKDIFLENDVQCPKIYELHNDLLFLPERMKIEKAGEIITNLHE